MAANTMDTRLYNLLVVHLRHAQVGRDWLPRAYVH